MMRRLISLLLLCALCLGLCGCSSIYEKEYTVIEDYVPIQPQPQPQGDKVTVRNYTLLKQAIQNMVLQGRSEGSIIFDQDYEGESSEDLANACWQVRTENALCAYCVENIAYEISTVMTNDEAKISIVYGDTGCSVEDIVRMPYATSLDTALEQALTQGRSQLVMLISYSTYTAASMEAALGRLYRLDPMMAPEEPRFSVSVFSGTGMQKLYDVSIDYGMAEATRLYRMEELNKLSPFNLYSMRRLSERERLWRLAEYMNENCSLGDGSSIYDALILHSADSRGIALATVALCKELEIECQAVFGQKNWQDYWWNIVELEGVRYQLDMSECFTGGLEAVRLCSDQQFWGGYRWDTSAYLSCPGSMSNEELRG